MNTSLLKNFAQQARTQLIAQVEVQLDRALNATGALAQEFAAPIKALNEEISRHGRAHVVEEAAYLWFNRFVALRFMDVNHYADLRAVSPATEADALPELLQLAKAGQLPDGLPVNHARLNDLLDGRLPSTNPEAEVYRILLRAECNRRHAQLPFLFERITDYSELLLPADLLSRQSILQQLRETLTPEVCEDNEEVIGWLYQFYISEKKDAVFAAKGKVKKEDIPAVTQLFTPRWIVEYMVQNTLGKLWLQGHPDSSLRDHMPYYLSPDPFRFAASFGGPEERGDGSDVGGVAGVTGATDERSEQSPPRAQRASTSPLSRGEGPGERAHERSEQTTAAALPTTHYPLPTNPQDLTIADQACGSGHILLYAFELLTRIYEESGYAKSEIPALILAHNLTGFEIDERAAQLAAFTLLMRARRYHRSSLRKGLAPRIVRFRDLALTDGRELPVVLAERGITAGKELLHDLTLMRQATNFGSLITPTASTEEIIRARTQVQSKLEGADLFAANALQQLDVALHQLAELSRTFWCVVDNPPYMGSGNMNPALSKYVKKEYPNSKSDLFSSFMERGLRAVKENGYVGMITMQSWMFLSSYEKLRKLILEEHFIASLLQIGYNSFPELNSKVAQAAAYVIQRAPQNNRKGVYYNLNDVAQAADKKVTFEQKIEDNDNFLASQADFVKIPGSPVGYWVGEEVRQAFQGDEIQSLYDVKEGVGTRNDARFIRFFWEISSKSVGREKAWIKTDKAGGAYRWFNKYRHVLKWENDGYEIRNYRNPDGSLKSRPQNTQFFYKEALSWGKVTSGDRAFRFREEGFGFNDAAPSIFGSELKPVLGLLNSTAIDSLIEIKGATINLTLGIIKELPVVAVDDVTIQAVNACIENTRRGFSQLETVFDFSGELYGNNFTRLNDWILYREKKSVQTLALIHESEELINKYFIQKLSLKEVGYEFSFSKFNIFQSLLDVEELEKLNDKLKRDPATGLVTNYDELELPFKRDVILQQFVSYAVGCMLGRYSLDKEGLILANAGDTLKEYAEKVGKGEAEWTFAPDEDGILPVLAGEYFPDDIVGRFRVFLRSAFGEAHFVENLAFVEECIGKDIRSYFVKDFYKDHVKRYKKRPIYWMFQSPGKHFRALVYLHRYQPDTVGRLLNDYLRPFIDRLTTERAGAQQVKDDAGSTAAASNAATKTIEYANQALRDCEAYQKDLLELARRRIDLDLDDGVLVNYNKMGDAVEVITGVNDAKGRKKVAGFDWVEWVW